MFSFFDLTGDTFPNVQQGDFNNYTNYIALSNSTYIALFNISTIKNVPIINSSFSINFNGTTPVSYSLISAASGLNNSVTGLLLVYSNNSLVFALSNSSQYIFTVDLSQYGDLTQIQSV